AKEIWRWTKYPINQVLLGRKNGSVSKVMSRQKAPCGSDVYSGGYHAVLRWAGSLFSDVASARTPSLRWSRIARTDSSSLRKSARRSRLFSLDALAASATMSCQDRFGLAVVCDMAR